MSIFSEVYIPLALLIGYALLQTRQTTHGSMRSKLIITTLILGVVLAFMKNYTFLIIGILMLILDIFETRLKAIYIIPK